MYIKTNPKFDELYYQKKLSKLEMKEKRIEQLDELVLKINSDSQYLVVGRFRGNNPEEEDLYGYSLERLLLTHKDNLDNIILTKFSYNNLWRKVKSGKWFIFNPITNFTFTRGGETLE